MKNDIETLQEALVALSLKTMDYCLKAAHKAEAVYDDYSKLKAAQFGIDENEVKADLQEKTDEAAIQKLQSLVKELPQNQQLALADALAAHFGLNAKGHPGNQ